MIEAIMYFGIGFLSAALIAVSIAPLVHARAVRLTRRRLENAMPQSIAEIIADKDLQRAEFALSTRRLEITMENLRERNATQRAEIGRKDDVINRFKIDRQADQVEMLLLQGEMGSLREQLCASNSQSVKQSRRDATAMLHDMPTAAISAAHTVASQASAFGPHRIVPAVTKRAALNNERDREGITFAPFKPAAILEEDSKAPVPVPEGNSKPTTDAGSLADLSIHLSPADHLAPERLKQGTRLRAIASVIVLIGGCGFWWAHYAGTYPAIVSWTQAIIEMPHTTVKLQSPAAEKESAPAPTQQSEQRRSGESDPPDKVEQFPRAQAEALNDTPASVRSETPKEALLSPAPQPVPETPPTTIPGWIVREVADGRAVVQGPNGIWRVARGDILPGAGRVDSIVRWGHRWIVATKRGLISTP
jgi:hypothetical protein